MSKHAPSLRKAILGGGWDVIANGPSADLDLSAFLVSNTGKIQNVPGDVVFFGNMSSNGVTLTGDNRTGAGDGDDEQIIINLEQVPSHISKIVFSITIYEATTRRQTFGMVQNAFVRLVDEDTGSEICNYQLTSNYATDTAVTACALNRTATGWEFEAIGTGTVADLNGLLSQYL